ncbi:MAG: phospholipase, partial [Deltaproteobacteria bacterium]|nr:phospholipase [Deltaproteobacteria bacterium]
TYPERFAAGVVAAGYTVNTGAAEMAQTPLWIFHGSDDTTADVSQARDIYQSILEAGGTQVTYTEFDGFEHVPAISKASAEPGLLEWILGYTRQQ